MTLKELHAVGANFVWLNDSMDFTTPSGQAMAGMLAVFAQYERDILRDRVKPGIAEARKSLVAENYGKAVSGQLRYARWPMAFVGPCPTGNHDKQR